MKGGVKFNSYKSVSEYLKEIDIQVIIMKFWNSVKHATKCYMFCKKSDSEPLNSIGNACNSKMKDKI